MAPFLIPLVAVVGIYCFWRGYDGYAVRKDRDLRKRVAYMLWQAAMRSRS